jgi:hypothetical protein
MRDDLTIVEQIQRELSDVRWPEPQEIRARARRRSRRRIVAAGVILAVAGASAVAVTSHRASPPAMQAAAPALPIRHEIPLDALLQPADLSPPVYVQLSQSGLEEPVQLDDILGYCRTSQGHSDGWQVSILSRSQTLLRKHPPEDRVESDPLVMQDLYRLAPEKARQVLTGLDDVIAPCTEWRRVEEWQSPESTYTTEAVQRWAVAQRGFAGDDAAILEHTSTVSRDVQSGQAFGKRPPPILVAVVRVGDTVSVLRLGYDGTESDLVQLAEKAATRMCAAANPAC